MNSRNVDTVFSKSPAMSSCIAKRTAVLNIFEWSSRVLTALPLSYDFLRFPINLQPILLFLIIRKNGFDSRPERGTVALTSNVAEFVNKHISGVCQFLFIGYQRFKMAMKLSQSFIITITQQAICW